jgi:hypothetical protein
MGVLEFLEVLFGVLGIVLGALVTGHVFFNVALPPLPFLTTTTLSYTLWFLVAINLGLFLYEEVRDVIYI